MTARTQQQRTTTPNAPPANNALLPGQLYTELADPVRLWVGVPTAISGTGSRLVIDPGTKVNKAGDTMSGPLVLTNGTPTNGAISFTNGDYGFYRNSNSIFATIAAQAVAGFDAKGFMPQQNLDMRTSWKIVNLATPTLTTDAATKGYVDTFLPLNGGTMLGDLSLKGDPATALQAATKQYVDNTGANVALSDTPPISPRLGDLWWDSVAGNMYVRYQDPNSTQWVATTNLTGLADAATKTDVAATLQNVGRNKIHNSMFTVAQRGAGPFSNNVYTMDRWQLQGSLDTSTANQIAASDAMRAQAGDEAMENVASFGVVGNAGAAAFSIFTHKIEHVRRLSGKTVIVSFYAASSASLKIGVSVDQYFGSGGSPSAAVSGNGQSITSPGAWARYSLTFAIPSVASKTLGTNGDDYTQLFLWLSAGSSYVTRSGNVGVQSGTIQLWGVQLEIASPGQTQPTPLEKPDPVQQLQQCQRFYQTTIISIRYVGQSGGSLQSQTVTYPAMRAVPTITQLTVGTVSPNAQLITMSALGPGSAALSLTSTATAGDCYVLGSQYSLAADL
jgi:hypothetical protein